MTEEPRDLLSGSDQPASGASAMSVDPGLAAHPRHTFRWQGPDSVPAGELIATLQAEAAGSEQRVAGVPVGLVPIDPGASASPPPDTAGPDTSAAEAAEPGTAAPDTAGPGTAAPDTAGPGTAAPDTAGPGTAGPGTAGPGTAGPGTAGPGTAGPDSLAADLQGARHDTERVAAERAADRAEAQAIREQLRRQHARPATGSAATAPRKAPVATGRAGALPGFVPLHQHHRVLGAMRVLMAFLAALTLIGLGTEWKILDRAETGIQTHRVSALDFENSNIATPRATQPTSETLAGTSANVNVKPASPVTYQPENMLLLGSDTRAGANAADGSDSTTTDGVANSDSLMIAHVSADRQHVTVLSIPRDTVIPAPTCKQWDGKTGRLSDQNQPISDGELYHINSAYSVGGPKCTVTAVQNLTHLRINRLIGIDFSGFKSMVDALGGITVNICRPIIDQELNTVAARGGVQVANGDMALGLVRARKVAGETGSDLARIHRQQVVLSAILRQVTAAGTLLNPNRLDSFLQAFTRNTFTENVKLEDLVNLAGSLGSLDPQHVTFYTLPTVASNRIDGALDVDQSKAPAVFDALVNDMPLPGEVTTKPKPPPTAATSKPSAAPTKASVSSPKPSVTLKSSDLASVNAGAATCA